MSHPQSTRAATAGSRAERTRALRSASVPSDLLAHAMEAIQEAVVLCDVEGRIHYANPAVEAIYGYSPEELIGRSIRIFEPAGRKPLASKIFRLSMKSAWRGEVVARKKDAGEVRVQLTASPVHAADGTRVGIVTVARDLAERDCAEQARRESEARYRSLFDASPDAIILTDLQTQILMCNRQTAALRGLNSTESFIGRSAFEFIAPEDHARATANAQKTLETGSVHNIEYTLLRDDGSPFPAELSAALIVDGEGNPHAFTAIVRDITDRKTAEDALRRQTDLYESLLRAQSDLGEGVAILDSSGRFLYVNEALGRIYGYSRDELLAMPSFWGLIPAELLASLRERFAQRISGETVPDHYEIAVLAKSGKRVEVEVAVKQLQTGGGPQIIALIRDIRERKRLEAELLQVEKLRSLGVMAAGVAHHINNVLAGVLGQADLLLETTEDDAVRHRLQTIVQSAQDGAAAVHRIKQFAYDTHAETCEQVNLATLVRDVVAAMEPQWKDQASKEERTITVETVTPEPIWTVGVASELREALINVLLNAVDALPSGGRIRVELDAKDTRATLRVVDDGTGMPEEVLRRVYDPFFTTKPLGEGTGLGLAITYGIMQRHSGSVKVRSKPGRGTMVELMLPVTSAAEEIDRPEEAQTPVPPLRVLVVDDEPALAEQLHAILLLDSHRVRVCHGGVEALAALAEEQFDLVITDLGMPGLNGWSVASEAKQRMPKVRVGLITGWANGPEGLNDPRKDCVDFIVAKPYRVKLVRDAIASAVSGLKASHQPARP